MVYMTHAHFMQNASLYYHWKVHSSSWHWFVNELFNDLNHSKNQSEGLVHDLDYSSWLIYSSLDQNNDLIDRIDQFYYQ